MLRSVMVERERGVAGGKQRVATQSLRVAQCNEQMRARHSTRASMFRKVRCTSDDWWCTEALLMDGAWR